MSILKTICLVVLNLALSTTVYADKFECAFIQDKYRNGKPNQASCSMFPEDVFSTIYYAPKPWQHCNIDSVDFYMDLEEVEINTDSNLVKWTLHYGFTEDAKEEHKEYLIKKGGVSPKEAENRVNAERKEEVFFRIVSKHTSKQRIYIDSITKKIYDPPKFIDQHHLIIENKNHTYVIYIPESSGHAILHENTGNEENSWIKILFGKCRKIKNVENNIN